MQTGIFGRIFARCRKSQIEPEVVKAILVKEASIVY